jgi:hypothetical protein
MKTKLFIKLRCEDEDDKINIDLLKVLIERLETNAELKWFEFPAFPAFTFEELAYLIEVHLKNGIFAEQLMN